MLWTKETTLCRVRQLAEHFGGDVVSQGVVLTGEHLHRVLHRERVLHEKYPLKNCNLLKLLSLKTYLKLCYLFSQFLNL